MSSTVSAISDADQSGNVNPRRQKALASCQEQILFFQRTARNAHWLHGTTQIMTIVLTATIPVILLADVRRLPVWLLPDSSARTLTAGLSALVAIAAGLTGAFHWQETWIRTAYFAQRLISERQLHEVRVGD